MTKGEKRKQAKKKRREKRLRRAKHVVAAMPRYVPTEKGMALLAGDPVVEAEFMDPLGSAPRDVRGAFGMGG